ncbi:MAG: EF-hand domain-containing protein [Pirellulales bacterium]|nr:EF-hand domain-containing protein [Pirellulales bacterium]
MPVRPELLALALGASLWCVGCSGRPGRLEPPGIPDDAGQQAVAKYDANGDGAIAGDELDKVPALKATLKRVDADGNGQVSAEEINARIEAWRKSRVALTRVAATVRLDGRPVSGAVVKLVPESFLGPSVKTAQGTTEADGSVHLEISSDPDERGVHLGYYRVEVAKTSPDGKEQIPARYNANTELGTEIARDDPNSDRLTLDLTSSGK